MENIKIFIASSSEVSSEREELEKYINRLSNRYKRYNLLLEPVLWENESKRFNSSRKQDDFNQLLLKSDIVIFMFGSRVGEYTKEEFDVAVQSQRKQCNPKHILTYFKNISLELCSLTEKDLKSLTELLKLKCYIEKNLNQMHTSFDNKIDLLLKVGEEIDRIATDKITNTKQLRIMPRDSLHEIFSLEKRLHLSDGLYSEIRQIRLMNISSNSIINPETVNIAHEVDNIKISDAIEKIMEHKKLNFEMILLEPNQHNLKDINTKIVFQHCGSSMDSLYSALFALYQKLSNDTIYSQLRKSNHFSLYLMKICMPFGIFNVEFSSLYKKYNHVKIDLYSAAITNESERRSLIIWQKDDPNNYDFFVRNFDSIKLNSEICVKINNINNLKKYLDKWCKLSSDN